MAGRRSNAAKGQLLRRAARLAFACGRVLTHHEVVLEEFAGIFAGLDFRVVAVLGDGPVGRPVGTVLLCRNRADAGFELVRALNKACNPSAPVRDSSAYRGSGLQTQRLLGQCRCLH